MGMYVVVEMQTNNGVTAQITTVEQNKDVAEQKYHLILSAAAVSNVEIHSAVILNPEGQRIKSECYKHEPQKQEEGEQ